jgi:hypothetical protein
MSRVPYPVSRIPSTIGNHQSAIGNGRAVVPTGVVRINQFEEVRKAKSQG